MGLKARKCIFSRRNEQKDLPVWIGVDKRSLYLKVG